nr:hypothetical protein [Tanacetum cinerariifolium]
MSKSMKVGVSMSRVQAWKEVVDKVKSRFSNWKMKALSIGGGFGLWRFRGSSLWLQFGSHLFFSCSLARQVARKISLWWDVTYVDVKSYVEWVTWMMSLRITFKLKLMLEVKGLSECIPSESNIRRIQVKDIVKEVKDYFKTYSSAGMDISWVDTMPNTETDNASPTINISQSVDVDLLLHQLLDSKGGSHITNVPTSDKDDFISWKIRSLVFLDGLEPYLITLEDGLFVPMSNLSNPSNPLPKRQNQWSNTESPLANQDKRLKSIIIGCLPNDVMKSVIKYKTTKEMWTELCLAYEGPSDTRDTKIVALRLKFNAFKALEGKKDSDSDVNEDNRTSNEFIIDLNAEYHERALLANQKRFYKRSGRDEGTTKFKAFTAIADDEPSVGIGDARFALGGKGWRKENNSKEVVFTMADVSTSESALTITSDSEDDSENQVPLSPLPKLTETNTAQLVRNGSTTERHSKPREPIITSLPLVSSTPEDSLITNIEDVVPALDEAVHSDSTAVLENKMWTMVPKPFGKTIIGLKWVFRNKMDEEGVVTKNKARLVAKGYIQEEGFQIKQDSNGISICQEKYVKDLLKKYDLADYASVKCLMLLPNNLGPDELGVSINETQYQANPKESHLVAVKRIFRYLKGTPNLGLWYPKGSCFDLKAYPKLDYARCNLERKSTFGGCQILGGKLVCWSAKKQISMAMSSTKAEYVVDVGCFAQVL